MRKRLIRLTAIVLASVTILVMTAIILAGTPWGLERARRLLVSRAGGALNGELRVDRLEGSLFGNLTLRGVTIAREGEPLISAETIRVVYRPMELLMGRLAVAEVKLNRPVIRAIEGPDGWNLAKLAKPRQPGGKSRPFTIGRIEITDGSLLLQPRNATARQIDRMALEASLAFRSPEWRIDLDRFSGFETTAGVPINELKADLTVGGPRLVVDDLVLATDRSRLSGHVSTETDGERRLVDVALVGEPLSLEELRRYVPAMPASTLSPEITISARGELTDLTGSWKIRSTAGETSGDFKTSGRDEIERVEGRADVRQLNLAPWLARERLASRLTGSGTFDIRELRSDAPRIDFTFDGSEVAIAGYEAQRINTRGTYRDGVVTARALGQAYGAALETNARWETKTMRFTGRGKRRTKAADRTAPA